MRPTERLTPGALILGASYRALGVVRSLGRGGVPVRVVRSDEHVIAATSRYVVQRDLHSRDEAAIVAALLDTPEDPWLEWAVLVPTHDVDAQVVSRHHAALSQRFRVGVEPWDAIAWAHDKRETYRLAERLGIDHPQTWSPEGLEDLAHLPMDFPVIVKPAFRPREIATVSPKAWPARTPEELESSYRAAVALMPPDRVMVQEFIDGRPSSQLAYGALVRDGEVLASIAVRRSRQRPMDFGQASTFVESIPEADLAEPAQTLLAATSYTGLVEVEYKRSHRDGRLQLLDVNPRTWGWMSIGGRAGVDLPLLQWRMLTGRSVPRLRARPGVRWMRMVTDLPTALDEVRHHRLKPRAYLRSFRPPVEPAVLALDDPLPALCEPPLLSLLAVQRAWRSRRTPTTVGTA